MKFFELIPNNTKIDFIGKFKLFVIISALSIVATVTGAFTKGFNFGIDFTGGTVAQIKFKEPHPIDKVRALITELGAHEASVVSMDKTDQEYLITARQAVDAKAVGLTAKLIEKVGADKVTISHADIVGPKVGGELKLSALRSLVFAVLLITIYIWFRFDFKFAPGATLAMIHDMMVAAGFYIVTQMEFDITAVAALLTIAGYSVNDTIVIYDRVRELFKVGGNNLPLGETINKAINMTLSRTIITSGATFMTVVPIAIFCDGPIKAFAETMLIGIFVGTYSSYYIAAPMTIYVERFVNRRQQKQAGRGRISPA